MNTIAFVDEGDPEVGVRILIDGRELIERVREIELPFATREGHPGIAGDYRYFGPMFVFLPARHFLGEPMHGWTDGPGRIYVLSCTCGIPECWPLSARVDVREHEVVWSEFRQRHRGPDSKSGEWRYDGLGPFVFARRSYEQELSKQPAPRKPPPPKDPRKTRLAEVFNLGFRRGANDRAAAGIVVSSERLPAPSLRPPPEDCTDEVERKVWVEGYRMGYGVGASDAELAGVDVPGAHGMISGFGQDFLERFGFLKGLSDEDSSDRKTPKEG